MECPSESRDSILALSCMQGAQGPRPSQEARTSDPIQGVEEVKMRRTLLYFPNFLMILSFRRFLPLSEPIMPRRYPCVLHVNIKLPQPHPNSKIVLLHLVFRDYLELHASMICGIMYGLARHADHRNVTWTYKQQSNHDDSLFCPAASSNQTDVLTRKVLNPQPIDIGSVSG